MTDPTMKRTLRNWMGDGVITAKQLKQIVSDGKVVKGKENAQLVEYSNLQKWGVI
jgi:hypothetical protein